MIRKTMFGFKLERTDETLTAHGGLALLTGFNHEPGLCALVDRYLLGASSNRGCVPAVFVGRLILVLQAGCPNATRLLDIEPTVPRIRRS